MITRKHILVAVVAACATLGVVVSPARTDKKPVMGSSIFEWEAVAVKEQKTGARRQFFQAPTATLDELECHATTINPGESPHAPHRHVEEEIMVVKEGTVEALVNGETRRAGPGSVIFQASNQLHGLRNVGTTQATYHVFKWKTPGAPRATSALRSAVFEWESMKATTEKYGARRQLFQSQTATLDELESHVTTLNPGETTGPPHRHPEEALVIVKEGTVEALTAGGEWRRVGPGSVVFEASNQLHGLRNAGRTQAAYHVIKWHTPATPKAKGE